VDRWTRSTGPVHRPCAMLTSSPRHRLRHHVQPQPATCRRHSPPAGCFGSFANKPLPFPEFTNKPFHLYKSLSIRSFSLCLGPCSP
jgi:hypothetical protein